MNNFVGAVSLTLIILLCSLAYILYTSPKRVHREPVISQAMLHYRYSNTTKERRRIKRPTQSQSHHKKTNLKVIIVDNNAYWVKDNIFYTAPMTDNHIDDDLVQQVDTISMNKVQLEQMLFIMDKLTEGIGNDSRSSGNE